MPLTLDGNRLRRTGDRIVRDAPRGQEEERDERAAAGLWVVVGAGAGRGPAGALPAAHAPELRAGGHGHDAVDLAVRVQVVLAAQDDVVAGGRVHVDGGHAAEARRRRGRADARAPVPRALHLVRRHPALVVVEPGADQTREVVVQGVARGVGAVQPVLEIAARREVFNFG